MIDRYTRPEMGHIFSLENKYAIWQEIEVLACEAQAELGKIGISKDEAQWIRDHANFEKAKVDEIGGHAPRCHRLPDQHEGIYRRRCSRGRAQA